MSKKNRITFYQNGSVEIVTGEGHVAFPYHTHNCFMLGIITAGQMDMQILDTTYRMEPGMVYVIPSNVGMSMQYVTSFSYTSICLKDDIAEDLNSYVITDYVIPDIGDSLAALCEAYQKHPDATTFVADIISLLQLSEKKAVTTKNPLILQAISYINTHAEEKCSVEEVADTLYLSKFYFCRLFKKEMGVTPKQYILQTKLRIVKEKLLAGNADNETRIAEDMDFAAQSHMCSLFKKYMGVSIRDYKHNLTRKN